MLFFGGEGLEKKVLSSRDNSSSSKKESLEKTL